LQRTPTDPRNNLQNTERRLAEDEERAAEEERRREETRAADDYANMIRQEADSMTQRGYISRVRKPLYNPYKITTPPKYNPPEFPFHVGDRKETETADRQRTDSRDTLRRPDSRNRNRTVSGDRQRTDRQRTDSRHRHDDDYRRQYYDEELIDLREDCDYKQTDYSPHRPDDRYWKYRSPTPQ